MFLFTGYIVIPSLAEQPSGDQEFTNDAKPTSRVGQAKGWRAYGATAPRQFMGRSSMTDSELTALLAEQVMHWAVYPGRYLMEN